MGQYDKFRAFADRAGVVALVSAVAISVGHDPHAELDYLGFQNGPMAQLPHATSTSTATSS